MTLTANRAEHFNLYYIFKEDKEQKSLSKESAADIWNNILLATKEVTRKSGASPPPSE